MIFRTDRFNTDNMMLNMPPFIFEDMFENMFEDSDHGPARCGPSARGGCRVGRGRHQG